MLLVRLQNQNQRQTKSKKKKHSLEYLFSKKNVIGQSSSKCRGLSVLTVIPPVLCYGNLFLVAPLKSKGR